MMAEDKTFAPREYTFIANTMGRHLGRVVEEQRTMPQILLKGPHEKAVRLFVIILDGAGNREGSETLGYSLRVYEFVLDLICRDPDHDHIDSAGKAKDLIQSLADFLTSLTVPRSLTEQDLQIARELHWFFESLKREGNLTANNNIAGAEKDAQPK